MGGLLDNIGNDVSAVINGVEHIAQDFGKLVEQAASDLASLGVGMFGGMEEFIQFLIHLGEDPVHVISRLWSHIVSYGGEAASVLEETAHGVLTYGLIGFCTHKANQAVAPVKNALNEQTHRGKQIADLHQDTLTTMQNKLTLLTTSGSAANLSMTWQGAGADAMTTSFGDISQLINQLNDQIHNNNQQAVLNNAFIQGLEFTGAVAIGMAVLDILLIIVNAIILIGSAAFAGVGVVAGAAIDALLDASVLALELEILAALVAADALLWLMGTLLIYSISIVQDIHTNIVYSTTKETPNGEEIRVRKLKNREVKNLKDDDGTPFEQEKARQGYPANADIYVDQDGNYWIGMPGSDHVEPFP